MVLIAQLTVSIKFFRRKFCTIYVLKFIHFFQFSKDFCEPTYGVYVYLLSNHIYENEIHEAFLYFYLLTNFIIVSD